MNNFYIAEIEWDPEEDGHIITSYSLYCAETYTSAMRQAIEDFGEKFTLSVKLTPCGDNLGYGILISKSLAHAFMTTDSIDIEAKEKNNG